MNFSAVVNVGLTGFGFYKKKNLVLFSHERIRIHLKNMTSNSVPFQKLHLCKNIRKNLNVSVIPIQEFAN